jgi:hypothetical protein
MEPRLWRDNEDALTTMASIVSRFQKKDMGPWIEIAEGVFECLKVAFGSKPHNKGALRSAIDHLLDISHHDGNIMSWLGKKSRREEADELLHFPTLFFEFRRYVGLHPGADMVGFISELFKLAKAEARFDIPHSVDHLDESPMFEKRYPLISHTIRKTRDTHKFNRLIRYTVDFINDDYRSGKRLSKFLPPRFLNGLKEEVDVRGKRVEDLRLQFEKIKQAYGYRAE